MVMAGTLTVRKGCVDIVRSKVDMDQRALVGGRDEGIADEFGPSLWVIHSAASRATDSKSQYTLRTSKELTLL